MLLWRGALAVGLGCCIVYVAVANASTPVAFTAPPLTAAVLLATMALAGSRTPPTLFKRRRGPATAFSLALADRSGLESLARQVARQGHELTLLSLRLDCLDDLGDTLGPQARTAVVTEAGNRVAACLRADETVVRLGADQLAVLLPHPPGRGVVLAEEILQRLREPITVSGVSIVATASIGIAADTSDVDELVRAADLAMHQATNDGGDRVRQYSPQLLREARERLAIESDLRVAVSSGALSVYYQPIVDTKSGRVRSVEALVRWDHPTLGLLAPPQFLGAAERIGLMVELGRHVLERACAQLAEWRRRWPHLAVAVNVSQAELVHPRFSDHVMSTLRRHGLPTSALHLEVTETVAVGEDTIATALQPLAAAGVACSLDDFGTGHSSLHRLRRLPVHRLKIDKSFVAEVSAERETAPLLASIISLAHSVGRTVVAEGVETSDQAAFLAGQGCDELQGYLFSRPVPADEVPGLLSGAPGTVVTAAAAPAWARWR